MPYRVVAIGDDADGEVVGVDGIDTCCEVPIDVIIRAVYYLHRW